MRTKSIFRIRNELTIFSVCIASVIRAVYVGQISRTDGSWSDALGCMWTVVELCLGVVSACLPTLRPLVVRTLNSQHSTYNMSHESRLENQKGTVRLRSIDNHTNASPHKHGFNGSSQRLESYVDMPSSEVLFPEQAHSPSGREGVHETNGVKH